MEPTRCLRLAYAVAVFSYAGTICLDLPTRAYAYQLFSDFAHAACVCCFCGLSVGLNSSHFAYAVGAMIESTSNILWKHKTNARMWNPTSHITTTKHNFQYHNKTLPPTPPTQKKVLTNFLKMPTKSLRAQAKCLRRHFTRHTLYKLNLPTKKRCSYDHLFLDGMGKAFSKQEQQQFHNRKNPCMIWSGIGLGTCKTTQLLPEREVRPRWFFPWTILVRIGWRTYTTFLWKHALFHLGGVTSRQIEEQYEMIWICSAVYLVWMIVMMSSYFTS